MYNESREINTVYFIINTKVNIMAEDKAKNDRIQVSMTMYTQQVEYMNQLDNPIDSYSAETVAKDIAKRLEDADIKTKYIATIMHDSDTLEVWNPKTAVYDLEPKENHYHSVIKFETRVDLDKLLRQLVMVFKTLRNLIRVDMLKKICWLI